MSNSTSIHRKECVLPDGRIYHRYDEGFSRRIAVNISIPMAWALGELAKAEGVTLGSFVHQLIEDYLLTQHMQLMSQKSVRWQNSHEYHDALKAIEEHKQTDADAEATLKALSAYYVKQAQA